MGGKFFFSSRHGPLIEHFLVGCMLIDNVQLLLKLYQPVSVKYLPDYAVLFFTFSFESNLSSNNSICWGGSLLSSVFFRLSGFFYRLRVIPGLLPLPCHRVVFLCAAFPAVYAQKGSGIGAVTCFMGGISGLCFSEATVTWGISSCLVSPSLTVSHTSWKIC